MDDFAVDIDKVLDDFEESEVVPVCNTQYNGDNKLMHNPMVGALPIANKPDITYEPLEKLDLSEADFAPATNASVPNLADELKFAQSSLPQNVNFYSNGHLSLSPEVSNSSSHSTSSLKQDANTDQSTEDPLVITRSNLQNGSQEFLEGSTVHRKLSADKPEILQSTSETRTKNSSENVSGQPISSLSDAGQGSRPDLIPTDTIPVTLSVSQASCHNTNSDPKGITSIEAEEIGTSTYQHDTLHQVNCEHSRQSNEESKLTISLNANDTSRLESPNSSRDSKENLCGDVSLQSTISSVASSMSSTISPKHTPNFLGKEETHCDSDQVDSITLTQPRSTNSEQDTENVTELHSEDTRHLPQTQIKNNVVGFNDMDDDDTEDNIDEELEAYLSGMEIGTNLHRGKQPNISDMVQSTAQAINNSCVETNVKAVPKTLNLSEINTPKLNSQNGNEDAKVNNASQEMDGKTKIASGQDQNSKEEESQVKRQSTESVEKFLAQSVMSPGISTPMEDAGFSRVPGYTPENAMASLVEELEEPEALRLALEGEGDNHSNDKEQDAKTVDTQSSTNICSADTTGDLPHPSEPPVEIGQLNNQVQESEIPGQTAKSTPTGVGARPKDPSQMNKKSRPNSLLGLSTPDLSIQRPLVISNEDKMKSVSDPQDNSPIVGDAKLDETDDMSIAQNFMPSLQQQKDNLKLDIKNQFEGNVYMQGKVDNVAEAGGGCVEPASGFSGVLSPEHHMELVNAGHTPHHPLPPPYQPPKSLALPAPGSAMPPVSFGDPSALNSGVIQQPDDAQMKQKRPTSLSLLPRGELPPPGGRAPLPDDAFHGAVPDSDSSVASTPVYTLEAPPGAMTPTPTISSNLNVAITELGRVAPRWVPDADAPSCMQCDFKFTFTKRRHHCRACGKVFCSTCCNLRCKIQYMDNKEARVCSKCYQDLIRAQVYERMHSPTTTTSQSSPNPNNPSEYCSTVPPLQQAQGNLNAPPPTVMVPVGVLRKDGNQRIREPKQVMFSDGIRPGGDLTELDGGAETRALPPAARKTGRVAKKVEKAETVNTDTKSPPKNRTKKLPDVPRNACLIPDDGLPPIILPGEMKEDYSLSENPDPERCLEQIKNQEDTNPVVFVINKNLFVMVKIVILDCCVNRVCWCFSTKGMCAVGQDEVVIVLECFPDEKTIPRDMFYHFHSVYEEANRGNTVSNLSHTIFGQNFLGSKDHGGFLYIRPSFQCLQKLVLPQAPYVFGILLQRWETPWVKVFPIRLMLRLGAEFRYYPCPLISVRDRKPVFGEIGHTIMNLLADFRNYQYMLPQIRGVHIHMEDKKTFINFPRNRYDEVMKVVNNSNEHVMALGANFSMEADSHLVCIQNDDGNYQTQAINIQSKPRKVTGASFVVFNGALKSSSGLRAKSSIVEDGLMVQILPDSMAALKNALRQMQDYTISCGAVDSQIEEQVIIQWGEDDKNINLGVKSPIDNMAMDGIESIRIHNATDYVGDQRTIRWTEVFFIQNEDHGSSRHEPVDLSRLAETVAAACCMALTHHLDKLKEASLTKIALRCTFDTEQVGYEVGSNGEKLPDYYMNDLDNELIPVIHSAASNSQDGAVCIELIFHVIE